MEAEGIVALVLGAPNGGDLPPFSAGSHIDVEVAPGMVRQYSLCNTPDSREDVIQDLFIGKGTTQRLRGIA